MVQLAPAASVAPWQFWLALNSSVAGAPPNMLIGPNGVAPVFVTVTATGPSVLPTLTAPKSMELTLISSGVSTARAVGAAKAVARAARRTLGPHSRRSSRRSVT